MEVLSKKSCLVFGCLQERLSNLQQRGKPKTLWFIISNEWSTYQNQKPNISWNQRHPHELDHIIRRRKKCPELETFNSHSTQMWSLAQQSAWQLIPSPWQFSDTSFLLLLVCLLTQAVAWHSDKKLTKSPQGKMKNKNGIRHLDLIFSALSVRDYRVWKGRMGSGYRLYV